MSKIKEALLPQVELPETNTKKPYLRPGHLPRPDRAKETKKAIETNVTR
jgi:hypothetical protein